MVPSIYDDQVVEVGLDGDTGNPRTLLGVKLYDVGRAAAAQAALERVQRDEDGRGTARTDPARVRRERAVEVDALADVLAYVKNIQGPGGDLVEYTDEPDVIRAWLNALPIFWYQVVRAAIFQPASLSATEGKG